MNDEIGKLKRRGRPDAAGSGSRRGFLFAIPGTGSRRLSSFRHHLFLLAAVLAWSPSLAGIDVDFTGNESFSGRALYAVTSEEPEETRRDDVDDWAADVEWLVEKHYRERGFLDAAVRAAVTPDGGPRDWIVTVTVEEGPRYRYGTIRVVVDGDSSGTIPGDPSLRAREGDVYREADVVRDGRTVRRAFGNAGFVRAEVRQHLLLRDSAATVSVIHDVTRGEAVLFDTLVVVTRRTPSLADADPDEIREGLTREDLLRSFFSYARGDTLRIDQNDDVIEKLQSTGQFNSVRLNDELVGDGSGRSVLTLETEEKVPGQIGSSLFYETQYGFGASGSLKHSNLAGTLQEGRLSASVAQNRQTGTIGYGSPLLFGRLLRFDNDLSVEWLQDRLPDAPLLGGDFRAANLASLSRTFAYWLRWVAGAEAEYKSRVVSDTAGVLDRERGGLLTLTNTGFLTFLDHPLNPRNGIRLAFTLGNGGTVYDQGAVRGLADYHNWIEARAAAYRQLPGFSQFVGAVRLDGGRFFGAGGQNADRFFLGGPRSVRSYGFRQLCPDAAAPAVGSCALTDAPIEPAYVLASAELRLSPFDFPWMSSRGVAGFFKPMEFVPFADYGKVWNLRGDEGPVLSREFLESGFGRGIAWGGGIRYPLLGVFNLRVDLAWGRPGGGSLPDQWLIDLAQAF